MIHARTIAIVSVVWMSTACSGDPTSPPGNGPPPANAVTLSPDRDNTLYAESDTLSNGAGEFMFAGATSATNQGALRRALLRFDIAGGGIPSGATIDSVRLTMRMGRTIAGPVMIRLHRLQADWGEAGSDAGGAEGMGARAAAGDATWLHTFHDGTLWTTPGGDFDPTASAVTEVLSTGSYSWRSATMTADVEGWRIDPGNNFGWIVIGDEGGQTTAKRFDSRNNSVAANRPQLVVFHSN